MKRVFILIAAILTALWLAGCGSTGKNFSTTRVADIQNKVTTQANILDWFGPPHKEGIRNGEALWTYQFDTYNAIGKDHSKDLIILFDPNSVVKAYRFSSNMEK